MEKREKLEEERNKEEYEIMRADEYDIFAVSFGSFAVCAKLPIGLYDIQHFEKL